MEFSSSACSGSVGCSRVLLIFQLGHPEFQGEEGRDQLAQLFHVFGQLWHLLPLSNKFQQWQFQQLHELPLAVHDIGDVKFHAFVASRDVGGNGGGVHEVVARLVQRGTLY